jgi:ABC-type nitrate/sulfonate/bicarbonate transport system substrate-binding protein
MSRRPFAARAPIPSLRHPEPTAKGCSGLAVLTGLEDGLPSWRRGARPRPVHAAKPEAAAGLFFAPAIRSIEWSAVLDVHASARTLGASQDGAATGGRCVAHRPLERTRSVTARGGSCTTPLGGRSNWGVLTEMHRRSKVSLIASLAVAPLLVLGLGAFPAGATVRHPASVHHSKKRGPTKARVTRTTAKKLGFTSRGTPNLKGWNIPIATAGSHPGVEDTLGYIIEQTLQKWGATSSLTLAESPTGQDAVVAGKIDAINSDMPSLINLPLEIFMPNQARLDYVFVARDVPTLAQLKGKTIDVGTTTSAEYTLMPALLRYAHLKRSQVTYDVTGSSSGSSIGAVLIAGKADAAWIHVSALQSLRSALGGHLYVLARASQVDPGIADSFWGATPQFIAHDPAIVEALCLAWISAAKTFNDHWMRWVTYAEHYTLNADPPSAVENDHTIFKSLNLWPLQESDYTPQIVRYNYDFYKAYGEFAGAGLRPLNRVAVFGPWKAAWKVYEAHPNAY